ncbi:MAG: Thioredoxin-like fold protein, partial [Campylobacterota bacterium]|nr:Thioredoxin-like fold protein [Campylobacterota bacterium]
MTPILKILSCTLAFGLFSLLQAEQSKTMTQEQSKVLGNKVVSFIKKTSDGNVKEMSVKKIVPLDDGWYGVVVDLKIKNQEGEVEQVKDLFLTNGKFVTNNLLEIEGNKNYRAATIAAESNTASETHDESFYNKNNLIFGSQGAANKVVIFSDPLCPFCMELFPKIYDHIKNKKDVAVYYYPLPLERLHPTSKDIIKGMEIVKAVKKDLTLDWVLYRALSTNGDFLQMAKDGDIVGLMKKIFNVDIEKEPSNKIKSNIEH